MTTTGKDLGYTYSRIVRVSGEDSDPAQKGSYHEKTNFVASFGYPMQLVKRVSVINVAFINSAYNFIEDDESDLTNTGFSLFWNDGAPPVFKNYTLTPGFYNFAQLKAAMEAAFADFKATTAPLSNVPTINAPTTGTASITWGAGVSAATVYQIFDNNGNRRGPVSALGFVNGFTNSSVSGEGKTPGTTFANYLPSLQGITDTYIVSGALAGGNAFDEKNGTANILVAVPVTAEYGTLNLFECKQDVLCEISYPKGRNIQRADFSLQDRYGNLVNLNGSNLKITLRVWFDTV